ncbi:hypothetical protein BCV72DRAFT_201361 [Rhizopus microsporus var. microsporus]|uniref:Uncharacterized protein n=1 Tax=Rhizopus microsporus var. microsporus TaxID=86635 RepID=A0A1X0RCL8_RHIZD|nr:hypothetical protein BCV72DRAFT_201361 [Rhizopus microsporus var. microsporus]
MGRSRARDINLTSDVFSGACVSLNIWGPVIEALFSNSSIKIKSGDTVLASTRGNHKIDYRLGIVVNQKFVNIGNIEVGRKAAAAKAKYDHLKLLLEVKTIVGRIIGSLFYSFTLFFCVLLTNL